MKAKILTLLMLCVPLFLDAQSYEQQGDELFSQAQYEKAVKKYNAAIEISGANSSLQAKKEKSSKCASLLARAKSAEQVAAESLNAAKYEEASRLYSELYSLHPLSIYTPKVTQLLKKADTTRIERKRREQEQQRADSIRIEIQKEHERQEQKKREEEKKRFLLETSNITIEELLDHPLGITNLQWTESCEILSNGVKKLLENGYSDTLYRFSNGVKWHLSGSIKKEVTLYYRVRSLSIDWVESQKGGADVTYEIRWSAPSDSDEQGRNSVLEYLKNDLEQYGISFTDTITQRRISGYYTRKKEMKNSITYACISKEDYKQNISLKILYHLDSRAKGLLKHVAQGKEGLYGIAQYYDVSTEELLKLNPIIKQKGLNKGQVVYIPTKR